MTDEQRGSPAALQPLDEDWETALAVVAHPDDMEFGAAAAVARWTAQGKRVIYCMVTSGEAGIDGMEPEVTRTVRTAEQIESARIVGVDTVEFLGLPDGIVEYGVPLRRVIARQVRVHRPDIVITGNFHPTFPNGFLNQADHIAVGRATVDAVRDAGNRWVFHEAGVEPWGGVRAVWVAGSPDARHGVDISATFDAGVASLRAHKAYLDGLGWVDFDPAAFLGSMAEPAGTAMGVRYATSFEVLPLALPED
ncbi:MULTISPECIES: PIG-L deacetylase family protein [Mumia]|uniref:PIG-L deacetylase family protein n=1 Tax=Mumia TaxID=1546255 RepID=UPI0014246691|nr:MULTISPECIES: PIG-L deacetylase family protein [unclassified Mumia]QMW67637.1 PIG-L family deacetylase [Mumia sp. ZJ1417]